MSAFFLLTLGAAVSMLIVPLAWRMAPLLGMVDMPDPRKVHRAPVPRVGGWGITVGSLVPLVLLFPLEPLLVSFVAGSIVLFGFGLWDDARQIDHWKKFAGQILATGLVVFYGDLYVERIPFLDGVLLPAEVGKPLTMIAMIGVINAINHSDGLDGLAGGESMLSLIAMAVLGYLAGNALVVGIALATIGGTLGFLRYNTHPARVFMGDTGSQMLGFTLGFLAVYLTQVAHQAVSAALPLLMLGLPLADILSVLYLRIRGGLNWFRATRNHVHHRLLDLGFSHFETVVVIYSVHASLVTCAVLLRYASDYVVAGWFLLVVGMLFAILARAESVRWRAHAPGALRSRSGAGEGGSAGAMVRTLPYLFVVLMAPLFMLVSACGVESVPRDFGIISGIMVLLLAFEMLRGRAPDSMLVRIVLYSAATFTAYLYVNDAVLAAGLASDMANAVFIVLALVVAIVIRFSGVQKFAATPTDYLIAFGLMALLAFDSAVVEAGVSFRFIGYVIVMFYCGEIVVSRLRSTRHPFFGAVSVMLVVLAYRGLSGTA